MKFTKPTLDALHNDVFSNGLKIKISRPEPRILDRFSIIFTKSRNKRVIHLGCADHIELIDKKIQKDIWLHKRIVEIASDCLGVDINAESIQYMQNTLGYEKTITANIITEHIPQITDFTWDILIAGEIVEHLDNPQEFLKTINQKYQGKINSLLITVPNAFSWMNFKSVFLQQEFINSDHRFWFTPYTLGKIATTAGYEIGEYWFCEPLPFSKIGRRQKLNPFYYLKYLLLCIFPVLRETLVMEIFLNPPEASLRH